MRDDTPHKPLHSHRHTRLAKLYAVGSPFMKISLNTRGATEHAATQLGTRWKNVVHEPGAALTRKSSRRTATIGRCGSSRSTRRRNLPNQPTTVRGGDRHDDGSGDGIATRRGRHSPA